MWHSGVCEAVQGTRRASHQQPTLMDSCSRQKMERVDAAMNQPLLRRRNQQIQPGGVVESLISGSNGSNPTKKWKYRTKALTSEVDESLLGVKQTPKVDTIIVQKNDNVRCKALSAGTRGHKPETIRINTSDLVRGVIAPSEDPSGLSLILTSKDSQRLKSAARVRTNPGREMATQAVREEKETLNDALREKRKQEEIVSTWCEKQRELARREEETIGKQNALREKRKQEEIVSSWCEKQRELARRKEETIGKQNALREKRKQEEIVSSWCEKQRELAWREEETIGKQNALREKGKQEGIVSSWCEKQRELALREEETIAKQKQSRLAQVAHKEHLLAKQAEREQSEFERVLSAQPGQLEIERKEQEEKKSLRMKHRAELLRQVREEQQKQRSHRVSLGGSRALEEEARERRARLDELKIKRLEVLRKAGDPDKYCAQWWHDRLGTPQL